jgi:hypothetical protein
MFVKTGQVVLGTARETLAVDWVEKTVLRSAFFIRF